MQTEEKSTPSNWRTWLKRIGLAGFLFFLAKGLVWIGIAAVAYYSAKD
jgi:hypothetical protein